MSWLLHSAIHQVMWRFWVFIMNPFSLLWSIFFSRNLCFLWSPCLLLITESINLDTSGKPAVGFFLEITSPSWIIVPLSLDELNSIGWLLNNWWVKKEFWYGKKCQRLFGEFFWILFFLNIIVNVNFFSDLKFEYYCECYPEILLQVSLK